jgi:hypothetical protein
MTEELAQLKVTRPRIFFRIYRIACGSTLACNPGSWENRNLNDFLNAMANFSEDIQGVYDNAKHKVDADKASWQTFADILKGATMYE